MSGATDYAPSFLELGTRWRQRASHPPLQLEYLIHIVEFQAFRSEAVFATH
jgi:hypothetical protein